MGWFKDLKNPKADTSIHEMFPILLYSRAYRNLSLTFWLPATRDALAIRPRPQICTAISRALPTAGHGHSLRGPSQGRGRVHAMPLLEHGTEWALSSTSSISTRRLSQVGMNVPEKVLYSIIMSIITFLIQEKHIRDWKSIQGTEMRPNPVF